MVVSRAVLRTTFSDGKHGEAADPFARQQARRKKGVGSHLAPLVDLLERLALRHLQRVEVPFEGGNQQVIVVCEWSSRRARAAPQSRIAAYRSHSRIQRPDACLKKNRNDRAATRLCASASGSLGRDTRNDQEPQKVPADRKPSIPACAACCLSGLRPRRRRCPWICLAAVLSQGVGRAVEVLWALTRTAGSRRGGHRSPSRRPCARRRAARRARAAPPARRPGPLQGGRGRGSGAPFCRLEPNR